MFYEIINAGYDTSKIKVNCFYELSLIEYICTMYICDTCNTNVLCCLLCMEMFYWFVVILYRIPKVEKNPFRGLTDELIKMYKATLAC